ncbi:MAG: hypothetical protein LBF27_34005 [Sphingobacterium sp.]|nr:hypothetical protein [Sphingobacterium sp.]
MTNTMFKSKWSIMLGMITLITISCSKKEEKDMPSGEHNISIRSVKYIDNDNVIDISPVKNNGSSDQLSAKAKVTNTSSLSAMDQNSPAPFDIQAGAEFDFITDIQTNAIDKADSLTALKASSSGRSLKAADVPLNQNKKFRLVFLQEGNSTPIYNGVLNAGDDPELKVAADKKYSWYAFSINDPNSVPDIDGSGNISSSSLANKDFMFASGEITATEGENYLDILFLRQMAAIDLRMNTRGMFGPITDNSKFSIGTGTGSSFTNIIQTGTFNIFNGNFSNLEDTDPIQSSEMTIVDSRWGNAQKIGRLFTANTNRTIPANNLRVRLNSLVIILDNNANRGFAANTIVPVNHSAELKLTKGTLSLASIRLVESGINVRGLMWARTNLIYDSSKLYGSSYSAGNSDAYRFRPNNAYAFGITNTEFWNFGTATPRGTDYQTVDPCRRVYPDGTWRLPQEFNNPQEITNLSQNTNRNSSISQVSDGYRHTMSWAPSGAANSAYPDNNLVLSYYGYRDRNGNMQSRPGGNQRGTGVMMIRSNKYSGNNTNFLLYGEVNNGSFSNISVIERNHNEGAVIRCVRNVTNN